MNVDSFLGEKRWEILVIIARSPSSPIELAKRLSVTVSYVSQQLKLLEAAGLVGKMRTGAAEKGKPRNIYFLKDELSSFSILTKEIAEKKVIYLTQYHKSILAIWLIENPMFHESYERFFIRLLDFAKDIEEIYLNRDEPKIFIVSQKDLSSKLESASNNLEMRVKYSLLKESKVKQNDIILFRGVLSAEA